MRDELFAIQRAEHREIIITPIDHDHTSGPVVATEEAKKLLKKLARHAPTKPAIPRLSIEDIDRIQKDRRDFEESNLYPEYWRTAMRLAISLHNEVD